MNKTEAFQLFDELPPPIAERAKRNWDESFFRQNRANRGLHNPKVAQYIEISFSWCYSPEGPRFWTHTFDAVRACREYPSVKGLPT